MTEMENWMLLPMLCWSHPPGNSRVLELVRCVACCSNGKALQKVFSKAVIMQVYTGCWAEPQLWRDFCGPQLSKVASNPPRLDYFGNNAPCERRDPWQQTLARCPSSRTRPNFHFPLAVDAFQNSLGGSQRCLQKPSWALLKNVNPSVSNNFTQTVTVPLLVLSTMSDSYPGDKWLSDVQNLPYLVSFSYTYRALSVHDCSLGRDILEKQGTGKSWLLWVAFFSDYEPSPSGERMQRFRLSVHSREGLSQLVVLHRKVTKKRKKHPVYVASKQLYAELAWLSNIWGLGIYFLLNGTLHEISARSLKAKLDPSEIKL